MNFDEVHKTFCLEPYSREEILLKYLETAEANIGHQISLLQAHINKVVDGHSDPKNPDKLLMTPIPMLVRDEGRIYGVRHCALVWAEPTGPNDSLGFPTYEIRADVPFGGTSVSQLKRTFPGYEKWVYALLSDVEQAGQELRCRYDTLVNLLKSFQKFEENSPFARRQEQSAKSTNQD